MRKISEQCAKHFWDGTEAHLSKRDSIINTGDSVILELWGHAIATREAETLIIDSCGYQTNTTKERLNGILYKLNWRIYQHKGVWYVEDVSKGMTHYGCKHDLLKDVRFRDGMRLDTFTNRWTE